MKNNCKNISELISDIFSNVWDIVSRIEAHSNGV